MPADRALAALAASLLLAMGGGLAVRALTDTTPPRAPEASAGRAGELVEEGVWVVPPGRERAVSAWLAPAMDGVSGRAIASIQIRGDEIRAALEGGGALVVRATGASAPRAIIDVEGVPPDPALAAALEARPLGAIFVRRDAPAPAEPPRAEPPPATADRLGMLGPAVAITGLAPAWLVLLALALGGLASLGARAKRTDTPRVAFAGDVAGALAVAALLRVAMAAWLPLETDEVRPLTSGMALFSEDHDAWLHPPLFRALASAWVEAVGWRPGGAPLLLRAPAALASALAALFAATAVRRLAGDRPIARFALVALLVAPTLVGATVLARPYALVALLAAIALHGVASRRLPLAVAAAGLAGWADPVGGALVALPVLAHALRFAGPRASAVALLALALFAAPLAPGVARAVTDPVLASHWDASVAAGQAASSGMGSGGPLALLGRVLAFTVAGLDAAWLGLPAALALGLVLARARRSRSELAAALVVALALASAVGLARSVRARNLVPLPFVFAAAAAAAAKRPRQEDEREDPDAA